MGRTKTNKDLPTYDELMVPVLEALKDLGGSATIKELNERVYEITNLSDDILQIAHSENDSRTDNREIGPGTDDGFADQLRDHMSQYGFTGHVDAHLTAGHTTWNPNVIRFVCEGWEEDVCGGAWIIQPQSRHWKKWVEALHKTDLKYRFPFMDEIEIMEELEQ